MSGIASISLRPGGALVVEGEGPLVDAFRRDVGEGLLALLRNGMKVGGAGGAGGAGGEGGVGGVSEEVRAAESFLGGVARAFLTRVCHVPGLGGVKRLGKIELPERGVLEAWVAAAPPMAGAEYLSADVLAKWWAAMEAAAGAEISASKKSVAAWVSSFGGGWHAVGRVTFHLAETPPNRGTSGSSGTEGGTAGGGGEGQERGSGGGRPFAFMATYSGALAEGGQAQHIPLGRALEKYGPPPASQAGDGRGESGLAVGGGGGGGGGGGNRAVLLSLLEPVYAAGKKVPWVGEMVRNKSVYRALMWTPAEAFRLLRDLPLLEEAGLRVRVPDWWSSSSQPHSAGAGGKSTGPKVSVRIGEKVKSGVGVDVLLDFSVGVTLNGETLTEEEIARLTSTGPGGVGGGAGGIGGGETLVKIRGKWARVDGKKLKEALEHWKKVEAEVAASGGEGGGGLSFVEGMRMLAGVGGGDEEEGGAGGAETFRPREEAAVVWAGVEAGEWLSKTLSELRSPTAPSQAEPPGLKAVLRPYQSAGVKWLREMTALRLGACLADDMGLGKTLQVIALLLEEKAKRERGEGLATDGAPMNTDGEGRRVGGVSLLVVPASLVGNWRSELAKFAPSLRSVVLHPSLGERVTDEKSLEAALLGMDLAITTYGMVARQSEGASAIREKRWDLIVLDEAQAIKNPGARQTRAVKELQGRSKIALTGTPVENRLGDLWSLFDFLNPGLLGNAKQFSAFIKKLREGNGKGVGGGGAADYGPLRTLTLPYILRRLKTDKRIIADLPEKTEVRAYCGLTKMQAALYETAVRELEEEIKHKEGIARRGVVLKYIMRFKQICNHPTQWTGDGVWEEAASGKFARLKEICEELAERQEKVLVFTQFQEMTLPLSRALVDVFGRSGLVLHGGTPVTERQELVKEFQAEGGPPHFVLSLKAGGTGLNLTAASHVIHFDRWWNPAAENQATDRAFRIGQKKNVMVHKFVVTGTIEERIDDLIEEKKTLAEETLGEGDGVASKVLSEMSDAELLKFVSLDVSKALAKE